MARFNTKAAKAQPTSRVTSTGRVLRTYEGGRGHERDARSGLFLLSVADFVSQQSFYESTAARDDRFGTLVRELALTDPAWTRTRRSVWCRCWRRAGTPTGPGPVEEAAR